MANAFLQDTSFWVLANRRRGPEQVRDRFRELLTSGELALNELVRLEILLGYKTREEVAEVAEELQPLSLLKISEAVWDATEYLGHALLRAGQRMQTPDVMIAASAIHYDAVLLHADSDFEMIAQHSEL